MGQSFDAVVDYRLDETGWERRMFPVKPGSQAQIEYGDLGDLDPAWSHLAAFDSAKPARLGLPKRLPASGYSHVMGVGGSTLHFTGEAHRLHPDSFHLKAKTGQGVDWPLTYADLEPLYLEAEEMMGVAGPIDPAARWRSAPYPLPPHPLSPGSVRLAEAAAQLGWHWFENARAALSLPRGDRPSCNYCGQCSRGCPIGDRGSSDVTFLPAAMETGHLTLVDQAPVVRLHLGPNARITAVDYIKDGQTVTQETPLLFLAGGAVQTPRLLLAQNSAEAPRGLANGSGQLGRNFMETLSCRLSGLAAGLQLSHRGLPADAISWQFNAPDAVKGAAGGFRMSGAVVESGLNGPINHGTRLVSGFGPSFKQKMRETFGSALSVPPLEPSSRMSAAQSPCRRSGRMPMACLSPSSTLC